MRIGIDLGGTKIEAIAIDAQGAEKFRRRVATPQGDYDGTVRAVVNLVKQIETELHLCDAKVGIGMPGALAPGSGMIKNSNSVCLNGKPFDRDMAKALGRPVKLANDANCFTLSEATDGAAAGAEVVFGVIIGTGTGGGIVAHGKILSGPNAIAGEWGHNPLPWPRDEERPGYKCYCGKSGCIETFLSGPGIARDFLAATGKPATGSEISNLAAQNDASAEVCFQRYEDRLARGLSSIINVLDPDVIVLGGGVSNNIRLYENVPRLWSKYVFSDRVATKLVKAKHGDSSGVRGAAWLWSE